MEALPNPRLPLPTSLTSLSHHHQRKSNLYQPPPPALISSATSLTHLNQIHAHFLRSNHHLSPTSISLLISSLALSSTLHHALAVFLHFNPPLTTANHVLKYLSTSHQPRKTLAFYAMMRTHAVPVNCFTFPPALKASARVVGVEEGREMHGLSVKMGLDSDVFVQTGLVGFYAACGCLGDARLVFDKMRDRDVVAWSVMMDGYSRANLFDNVLMLFEEMKSSGVHPDPFIITSVLSACSRCSDINFGKELHRYIYERNFSMDSHLLAALINMYANCRSMDIAQKLYDEMPFKSLVASTAMVSGYSRLGNIVTARQIFDQMLEKDLVSWSAMIASYADSDQPIEALKLFNEMLTLGIQPDQITLLSVISACACLGALDRAKWIHIFVDKNGFNRSLPVNNALIDMYAKCGSLVRARQIFNSMHQKNVISWTSMITGFAMHGDGLSALSLFEQMKVDRIDPNAVTFVGVLYACSHGGLVEEGRLIFSSMINDHCITPTHEHFGCMVDLLGRANLLEEAVQLVKSMPFEPNVVVWGSLLGACRVHNNVKLGEFAAKRLIEMDPHHDGAHVLLSNIYAKAGRWGEVLDVRSQMKKRGIAKEKGCSWIELNGEIHEFVKGDDSHPKTTVIYEKLNEIVNELKLFGYVPNTGSVLVDLGEEDKEEAVLLHSEKLALAFGLLNVEKGSCIRIVKNLRVCEDCHIFLKCISKVFEREIVVRDRSRFHHYKFGECSCKDYW